MKKYTPPGILQRKCEGPPVCMADDNSHLLFEIICELFGPCALTRPLAPNEMERLRRDPRVTISPTAEFFKDAPKA